MYESQGKDNKAKDRITEPQDILSQKPGIC